MWGNSPNSATKETFLDLQFMMMLNMQIIVIVMALLWFPANRIIGGQVPGILVAQAEIIEIGKSSHFDFA